MPGFLLARAIEAYRRFRTTADTSDIDLAVKSARLGLIILPDDFPDKADYLHNLGVFIMSRYERTGDMADL